MTTHAYHSIRWQTGLLLLVAQPLRTDSLLLLQGLRWLGITTGHSLTRHPQK